MFTTTVSMWLGIAFLALAIAAVLLQAWLWGPAFWDEATKTTRAPRVWLRVHAATGYSYATIYLFMMWHMVPRMWEYQYELPARTVVHIVVAIIIGVVLVTKIMILRFFRHFEEAMPRLGFSLLLCTVVLVSLSVPYALRVHDLGGQASTPENLQRVQRLLAGVDFDADVDVDLDALASPAGVDRGREVLVTKCTPCHDMRTILAKPRTAAKWHAVSRRMLDKPAVFGERLRPQDVPWVTAYLAAITPEIQESYKQRRDAEGEQERRSDEVGEAVHQADAFEAPVLDEAAGQDLLTRKCTECHELDEIEAHGADDLPGWRSVVAAMVEEGAEMTDLEAAQVASYLAAHHSSREGEASIAKDGATPPPSPPTPASEPVPQPAADPKPEVKPASSQRKTPRKARRPKAKEPVPEPATPDPTPADEPPVTLPRGDRAAGKMLFAKKCKTCHGADGAGDTAYGQKIGVSDLKTSTLSRRETRAVIEKGRGGTKMKGYGSKLTDRELEDVTAFVVSLR